MNRADFETGLENFRAASEEILLKHFADQGFTFAVPFIETADRRGAKYVKLWRGEGNERGSQRTSIHAFVEIATGDIYKPASTKAPAKHKRGNIYDDAGRASMTRDAHVHYIR